MPMHQPDCDAARKYGEQIGTKIRDDMIHEHRMTTAPFYGNNDRWEKARQQAIEAIAELFVQDVCNNF